jgi:peptidyl-prolyl cis-trans isomerase D
MLDSIRQGVSSWVIKILLGLLILSFAVWGIGDIFIGSGANPAVATVGGKEISTDQFIRTYQRDLNDLARRLGRQITPDEGRQFGLVGETVRRVVIQTMLDETADDYGVTIGDELLRESVFRNEAFQDATGRFDQNRFLQTLAQNGLSEEDFVSSFRRDLARDQVLSSISVGAFAPAPMVRPLFEHRNERRVAELAVVRVADLADPAEPDVPTLVRFHEENEARYMAPEYRAVTYVWIAPDALYDEIEVTQDELERTYNDRINSYFQPERRKVEQLIYDTEEAALAARQRLAAGETFDSVAGDSGAFNAGATDLGMVEWNDLPSDLADAVFDLAAGVLSQPLTSAFGFHVVRVDEIAPEGTTPLEEVRAGLEDEIRRRRSFDGLQDLVDRLEDEMAGGRTLEDAASRVRLTATVLPAIDRAGNDRDANAVEGIADLDRFIDTVFSTDVGQVSEPQESSDNGYFVVRVDNISPEAVRPLNEIRVVVVEDWKRDQKLAAAKQKADDMLAAVKGGRTLEDAAAEQGAEVVKSEALTRTSGRVQAEVSAELVSQLFDLKVGEYATAETADREGYAVARLDEVLAASPATNELELAQLRDILNSRVGQDIVDQYLLAVQNDVGVSVNQGLLETLDLNALPATRRSSMPLGGLL